MISEAFPILTTPDLPRALAFYVDLLGGRLDYRFPAEGDPLFVTVLFGQSTLGLGADAATAEAERDGGAFSLCVYVDDCDAAVARLREAGSPVLTEPADQPWGERMAEVADPDGVRLMLMARLDPS